MFWLPICCKYFKSLIVLSKVICETESLIEKFYLIERFWYYYLFWQFSFLRLEKICWYGHTYKMVDSRLVVDMWRTGIFDNNIPFLGNLCDSGCPIQFRNIAATLRLWGSSMENISSLRICELNCECFEVSSKWVSR